VVVVAGAAGAGTLAAAGFGSSARALDAIASSAIAAPTRNAMSSRSLAELCAR